MLNETEMEDTAFYHPFHCAQLYTTNIKYILKSQIKKENPLTNTGYAIRLLLENEDLCL